MENKQYNKQRHVFHTKMNLKIDKVSKRVSTDLNASHVANDGVVMQVVLKSFSKYSPPIHT